MKSVLVYVCVLFRLKSISLMPTYGRHTAAFTGMPELALRADNLQLSKQAMFPWSNLMMLNDE